MKKAVLKNKRLKIHFGMGQNNPEWDKWRQEGVGASVGYDACNLSKPLFDQFLNAKVPASIDGLPAIERGNLLEPVAREMIEVEHMIEIVPLCAERGFLQASADGVELLGNKPISGHEIKCPEIKGHEKHLRGELGHQKFHQLQQSMWVFGLKVWSFWSFCPEHETPLHEIKVEYDDKYIQDKWPNLVEFWQRKLDRAWPDAEIAGTELAEEMASGIAAPALLANVDIPTELNKRTVNLIAALGVIKIVEDEAGAAKLTDLLSASKQLTKSLEEKRKDIVQPHWDFKKEVDALFNQVTASIKLADSAARQRLLVYKNEQERLQRERERIERERLALIEQQRLDAERKERERIEAEQRKEREAAEKAAQEATNKKEADAAAEQLEAAKIAEETEKKRIAEAEAAQVHEKVAERPAAQTRGSFGSAGTRKKWVFEVKNMADVPGDFLQLNEKAVNAEIKAQVAKGKTPEINGFEIRQENTLAVR